MRNTKQKQEILYAVRHLHTHPTADEIYTYLKQHNSKLSLGTVYRNLNRFSQTGKIKKIAVSGAGDRFDFRLDDHEHFICEQCGCVTDVEFSQSILEMLSQQCCARLISYDLMLYGLCEQCAYAQDKTTTLSEPVGVTM